MTCLFCFGRLVVGEIGGGGVGFVRGRGRVGRGEETQTHNHHTHPVSADAKVAVAQLHRLLGRDDGLGGVPVVDLRVVWRGRWRPASFPSEAAAARAGGRRQRRPHRIGPSIDRAQETRPLTRIKSLPRPWYLEKRRRPSAYGLAAAGGAAEARAESPREVRLRAVCCCLCCCARAPGPTITAARLQWRHC